MTNDIEELQKRLADAEEALRYIAEPLDDYPSPEHQKLGDLPWMNMAFEQNEKAVKYFNKYPDGRQVEAKEPESIWDNPPVDRASLFISHMIYRGLINPVFDAAMMMARARPGEPIEIMRPNGIPLVVKIDPAFSTVVTWTYKGRPVSPAKAKFILRPDRSIRADWNIYGRKLAEEVDNILGLTATQEMKDIFLDKTHHLERPRDSQS